jgi:hypothetical protein
MAKQNPATMGGASYSVGDLLGGDHVHNKPSAFTLQVSTLVSRFALPIATAAAVAEIAFRTEERGL